MGWELRDNQGSLFKNERRNNEKHPHMTGTCMIDGVVYYISAWTKEGSNGRFQSLAFKRKEDDDGNGTHGGNNGRTDSNRGGRDSGRTGNGNQGNRRPTSRDYGDDPSDDIPF